jgi:hypothetical protein
MRAKRSVRAACVKLRASACSSLRRVRAATLALHKKKSMAAAWRAA